MTLLNLEVDRIFVAQLCMYVLILVLIMYFQSVFGPRFFVPKTWRKGYYTYERKIKDSKPLNDAICSICFSDLTQNPEEIEGNLENEVLVKTFFRTPCNHDFHRICLTKWMDMKLVCPSCREILPPVEI